MSFNQFMHPRNIYRKRIDFKELALQFPEFAQHLIVGDNEKVTINYNDSIALRSLTKCLLKKDFKLDVEIPDERLIPTLPMRLNYILWIEDLIQYTGIREQFNKIIGLDIGTGCCAIFPLLGVTLNSDWFFIGTEIDTINLQYSKLNVAHNRHEDKIKIIENKTETMFKNVINEITNDKVNFIICNPPFFKEGFNSSFENEEHEQLKRPMKLHQKKVASSCSSESVVEGGEMVFIKNIIDESIQLKDKIDIYTVMIGHKKSFLELKHLLKDYVEQKLISSFIYTELCQGNTKRWAIAWSFNFDLQNAPRIKCIKAKSVVHYLPSTIQCCEYNIKAIADQIKQLLIEDLKIQTFNVIETKKVIEFEIKANINTWSNQRRKRRQALHKQITEGGQIEANNSTPKRQLDSDDDNDKMTNETLEDSNSPSNGKRIRNSSQTFELCKTELTLLLHCSLKIKRDKREIFIKMTTKEMSQNKDSTFQLLQYFKNKLI